MNKEQVIDVVSVLDRMDKEKSEAQRIYGEKSDAFDKQMKEFKAKYEIERVTKPYEGYESMLKVGRIKSVRDTLKQEFVDFARCVKSSKTVVLCKYEDSRGNGRVLTMGKFGIGRREHMKSTEISGWDMERIAKNSVAFVAALRANKKVREADAVEKFFGNGVQELMAEDDRAELAYEEPLNEHFSVLLKDYEYKVVRAERLRVSWDADGDASLSVVCSEGKHKIDLNPPYRSGGLNVEMTVPYLFPVMDGFIVRAKEYAKSEILKRDTLVETATAPLMPYLMARRL